MVQTNYRDYLQLNSWMSWIDLEWRWSWVGVEMELGVELELDNWTKIAKYKWNIIFDVSSEKNTKAGDTKTFILIFMSTLLISCNKINYMEFYLYIHYNTYTNYISNQKHKTKSFWKFLTLLFYPFAKYIYIFLAAREQLNNAWCVESVCLSVCLSVII